MVRLTLAVALATVPQPPAAATSQDARPAERARLLEAAREIMTAARYCALVTLDESGRPVARTVDPFAPDADMTVWLATNPLTRKVKQIARDPRVTLHYFDPGTMSYVTLLGNARLVDDPQEKARRWKDGWEAFYPDREKGYLLVEVTPERLEVVSVARGIEGDAATWTPPAVTFAPPR